MKKASAKTTFKKLECLAEISAKHYEFLESIWLFKSHILLIPEKSANFHSFQIQLGIYFYQ
jgi:hypothetical protein